MRIWTKVSALLPEVPEDWAVWHEVFAENGIDGTLQEDHPPTLSAYAVDASESELNQLRSALEAAGAKVTLEVVPEENWAESWKQFFKPRRIGRRFVVRPTWEEFEAQPDDLVIVLDPGQSFGTGDHPTTRMCLEILEDLDLAGKTVADVGCGTGILSVGACMLGADPVVASDIEDISVESTRENAERNHVEFACLVGKGFEPYSPDFQADLVVSNIISAALIRLAPETATRVRSGGHWVVSGIIEANWPDVQAAAESAGFELEQKLQENEWIAARFRRL